MKAWNKEQNSTPTERKKRQDNMELSIKYQQKISQQI